MLARKKPFSRLTIGGLGLVWLLSMISTLVPFSKVVAEPNYSVSWNNNEVGQYPLRLTSSWFKSYETADGKKTATNNTIPITREQAGTGPVTANTLLFVTINRNSFENNRECEVQLKVTRPINGESAIIVEAFKPSEAGDSPACSDKLIAAMERVVEPDGDNTVTGPGRDNDPNTDTEEEAEQDRQNIARAEESAGNKKACTEKAGLAAGWIVCGLLELMADGIQTVYGWADSMLNVDGQELYNNEELRAVWSYFRVIATFALVAIGLIMVISQAIGGGY